MERREKIKHVTFTLPTTFYVKDTENHYEWRKRFWENHASDRIRFIDRLRATALVLD